MVGTGDGEIFPPNPVYLVECSDIGYKRIDRY
jgi:hypothetical protein